jgi:GxxExxY protein
MRRKYADRRGKASTADVFSGVPQPATTRAILGAFYAVRSELGTGFLEVVYANAVAVVLGTAGRRVEREVPYEMVFRGQPVGRYRADMIVDSLVIVEVKAAKIIDQTHSAQLHNYLRVSGLQVGLLLNFGRTPDFKRVVCTQR